LDVGRELLKPLQHVSALPRAVLLGLYARERGLRRRVGIEELTHVFNRHPSRAWTALDIAFEVTRDAKSKQLDALNHKTIGEPSRKEIDGAIRKDVRVGVLAQLEELQEHATQRLVPLPGADAIRVESGEQDVERILVAHCRDADNRQIAGRMLIALDGQVKQS
jgi:hypothetical protein